MSHLWWEGQAGVAAGRQVGKGQWGKAHVVPCTLKNGHVKERKCVRELSTSMKEEFSCLPGKSPQIQTHRRDRKTCPNCPRRSSSLQPT